MNESVSVNESASEWHADANVQHVSWDDNWLEYDTRFYRPVVKLRWRVLMAGGVSDVTSPGRHE